MKDWNGNYHSIYATIGARNFATEARESNDYYATDPVAIDKLLTVEQPCSHILECAAGEGHLAERLRQRGFEVTTNDLVQRNYKLDSNRDFLAYVGQDVPVDIVTNPPYKFAKEFVLKALDYVADGHKVYMFLKLTFLEGKARYAEIFSKTPPRTVYVFSERVQCAKNGIFTLNGSAVVYAWFVWQKGWTGDTTIKWL